MKAIVQEEYGSPDVLELREIEEPVVEDDQVLVSVRAAAVNISDWHLMRGIPYMVRAVAGPRRPRQAVPGVDLAGRVEAVGKSVTRFRPGDEVFGWGKGAFAERACCGEDTLLPKPANLTYEQAAAIGDSAITALNAVRDQGKVQRGHDVLINGASGGVGTFAVQIAKSFGANVTGVCSSSNLDLVRSIGADEVIDYTREDFAQAGRRYDVMLDMVGNRSLSDCRRALTPRGTYVLVGVREVGRWLGFAPSMKTLLSSPFMRQRMRVFLATRNTDDLAVLKELLESGQIEPIIDRRFELSEVPEALRYQGGGHVRGKIVISE
jgi:NADPH:quinone reductase-like Zn-dependent oxidoreductase